MADKGKLYHLSFSAPPRVMLMDKSTPLVAVTGWLSMTPDDPANMIVKTTVLYTNGGTPTKATMTMLVNRAFVVSLVEVIQQ
jgi:hypothetical protein